MGLVKGDVQRRGVRWDEEEREPAVAPNVSRCL